MNQEIIDLYDAYTHEPLPRRVFMTRLVRLTGSLAAANALLPLLEANHAAAQLVAPDDDRLHTARVTFPGASGEIRAYLARPRGKASGLPTVVVIHENRGLNPHIEDVARRLAVEGFLAIAPDALSPLGGTPADPDEARRMIYRLDPATTVRDYAAAVSHAARRPESSGRVGCVGFCWGGGVSNRLAIHADDLSAAVVFYGRSPDPADVPKIRVPLLMHYAGLDGRINSGVPAYEAALQEAGKTYTAHTYPGVNHAFHNDTAAARYDREAARLAWSRTLEFFSEQLR